MKRQWFLLPGWSYCLQARQLCTRTQTRTHACTHTRTHTHTHTHTHAHTNKQPHTLFYPNNKLAAQKRAKTTCCVGPRGDVTFKMDVFTSSLHPRFYILQQVSARPRQHSSSSSHRSFGINTLSPIFHCCQVYSHKRLFETFKNHTFRDRKNVRCLKQSNTQS